MLKNEINVNPSKGHEADQIAAAASSNPFDLGKLKLSQDFEVSGGAVKKLITTIPVKKPNKQAFIRAFDPEFQVTTAIIELKGEQDGPFLVAGDLRDELLDEIQIVHLATCVDRSGNLFLWPLKLPKAGERNNPWNESALSALKLAQKCWVRVSPNMSAGHYDVFGAVAKLQEPASPELPLQQIIEIAFKGKLIESVDHPVVKKLRGEE